MDSRILIVGGAVVVGGGLLAWLATREETAVVVTKVAARVRRMRGVQKYQLDRIAKYNIHTLVDQYRGRVPWATAMAMMAHESDFEPARYNYYKNYADYTTPGAKHELVGPPFDARGRAKGSLGGERVYGAQGAGKWGGGYFKYDPHAIGLYQILDNYITPGSTRGYNVASTAAALDAEANIRAALEKRDAELGSQGSIPDESLPFITYLNHAEGKGKTDEILKWARANGGVTPAVLAKFPGKMGNRMSGVISAMSDVPLWEDVEKQLRGYGTLVVVADEVPGDDGETWQAGACFATYDPGDPDWYESGPVCEEPVADALADETAGDDPTPQEPA